MVKRDPAPKYGHNILKGIALGVTFAIGATGVAGCTTGERVTASAPASPGDKTPDATPSSTDTSPSTNPETYYAEKYHIPAKLSDEQLAQAFIDMQNNMVAEGASTAFRTEAMSQNGTPAVIAFCQQRAEDNIKNISSVVLAEGAGDNSGVAEWLNNTQDINGADLYLYSLTSGDDPADKQPYKRWAELTGVKDLGSKAPNTRVLEISWHEYENDEDNRIGEIGSEPYKSIEGTGKITVTFVEIDGSSQISNVHF